MMTEAQKRMKKYTTSIERRLNLPRDVKARVMNDFITTISAMREAGKSDEEIYGELGTPKKVAADLNEQMKEFAYRKSPWRFAFLAVAVVTGLWFGFNQLMTYLLLMINNISISFSGAEAASIGIIGGADGPTSIFVAASPVAAQGSGIDWDLIIVLVLLIGGIAGYLRLRRCKPKN